MYKVDAAAFHSAMGILQQVISRVENSPGNLQHQVMSADNRKTSQTMLRERLATALEALPVPITKLAVTEAAEALNEHGVQYLGCGQLLLNISETLRRELTTSKVFSLDAAKSNFYEPTEAAFGAEVESKFPGLAYEIDQAGKCYACDLTTASVFHLMRCLEAGIRAIARCLGIPDPTKGKDRNWSNINSLIKTELEKRWPASSGRMSGDAQIFDEIFGALAGMQNPYRNATMHLEAAYTAPEALHIFEVVKGLMKKIASRMDEQGQPLA